MHVAKMSEKGGFVSKLKKADKLEIIINQFPERELSELKDSLLKNSGALEDAITDIYFNAINSNKLLKELHEVAEKVEKNGNIKAAKLVFKDIFKPSNLNDQDALEVQKLEKIANNFNKIYKKFIELGFAYDEARHKLRSGFQQVSIKLPQLENGTNITLISIKKIKQKISKNDLSTLANFEQELTKPLAKLAKKDDLGFKVEFENSVLKFLEVYKNSGVAELAKSLLEGHSK